MSPRVVPAAGAVLWRRRRRKLEVALIHRPRYDDWSWPKGKLDPGEDAASAAVREVAEETGLQCQLGVPLPRSLYSLACGDLKEVRYWAARVVGGDGVLEHEVDQVEWLSASAARRRLTHPRDALQLQALIDADAQQRLDTWPLLVIRHASSVSRSRWHAADWLRPLDEKGRRQAEALSPVLAAYAVERVVSSPSTRCIETVEPYVRGYAPRFDTKNGLSEERFATHPDKVVKHTLRALERGVPTALCTHRPLLSTLFNCLVTQADPRAVEGLQRSLDKSMEKAETLICHITGSGTNARVVQVDQHLTPPGNRAAGASPNS